MNRRRGDRNVYKFLIAVIKQAVYVLICKPYHIARIKRPFGIVLKQRLSRAFKRILYLLGGIVSMPRLACSHFKMNLGYRNACACGIIWIKQLS